MTAKKILFILLIATTQLSTHKAFADITQDSNGTVYVTNSIRREDYEILKRIEATKDKSSIFDIELNSNGGDIEAALNIGRLFRSRSANVNVGKNSICFSACVFLLAGATQRAVQSHLGAKVAIHRPYDPADNEVTLDGQKRKQQKVEKSIRKYLSEVNIPASLYEDMLRIGPDDLKVLSKVELSRYGLNSDDPYFSDARDTQEAKKAGLSKVEYLSRKAQAKVTCPQYIRPGQMFDDLICEANIIRGLPPTSGF